MRKKGTNTMEEPKRPLRPLASFRAKMPRLRKPSGALLRELRDASR